MCANRILILLVLQVVEALGGEWLLFARDELAPRASRTTCKSTPACMRLHRDCSKTRPQEDPRKVLYVGSSSLPPSWPEPARQEDPCEGSGLNPKVHTAGTHSTHLHLGSPRDGRSTSVWSFNLILTTSQPPASISTPSVPCLAVTAEVLFPSPVDRQQPHLFLRRCREARGSGPPEAGSVFRETLGQ